MSTTVQIDRGKRRFHLGVAEPDAQSVQQLGQLGLVNLAIAVGVDAFEAVAQRIQGHGVSLRRLARRSNGAVFALGCALLACRNAPQGGGGEQPPPALRSEAHPVMSSEAVSGLPALRSDWLVQLGEGDGALVVMPPVGAVAPARLVIGIHGAGDRPDWACGGWRLAAQVTTFVACPQGHPLGASTFAWVSPQQLERRALETVSVARARYADYLAREPLIFAGFSQGATYAEPVLRRRAALFPIAILAEGGYQTARSPSFAAAYRAGGGRRVVLVCGTPGCFANARAARPVLERASLEVLIAGDPHAGHNLNGQMQKALQAAWADITAPLVRPSEMPPVDLPAASPALR